MLEKCFHKKLKKVVVALSGGVDSSVAALLLKKQGYEVIGLFMHNWDDNNNITYRTKCLWLEDSIDAMLVAQKLDIPFQVIDMRTDYKEHVINYMFSEYADGRTPNPDILCNREIKFNLFLKKAYTLGADNIATGHYVRKKSFIKNGDTIYQLLTGKDINKDQSYFLCQLNQYQLSKSLFPLGMLTKEKVRQIALASGLITAKKKDSQGLCFVGKISLSKFLEKKLKKKKGNIIEILPKTTYYYNTLLYSYNIKDSLYILSKKITYKNTDGNIIGLHEGAHFFTKGQRKGLSVGGYKDALFVIDIDTKENIIYAGMGKNHPGLYKKALFIEENKLHWIREDLALSEGFTMKVYCRIRYRQPLQEAILYKVKNGLYIKFIKFQFSITGGQFAAWYINEEVIGSGIIS